MQIKNFLILFILLFNLTLYAQVDNSVPKSDTLKTKEEAQKSYFLGKLQFTSNESYNGRTDANVTPIVIPTFGYFNKSGFSLSTSLIYSLAQGQQRIEAYMFDLGYDHQFSDKFSGGISADKSIYTSTSTLVKSTTTGSFGVYLDYNFNFVNFKIDNSIVFSKKADFMFSPTLYKEINLVENGSLTITPTLLANFSSLNYYEDYSDKINKIRKGKKGIIQPASTVETITVNNKKVTLLDYELSVPVEYKIKKLVLFVSPMVAFPVNPIYTTSTTTTYGANGSQIGTPITADATDMAELNLKNKLFVELGLFYKL